MCWVKWAFPRAVAAFRRAVERGCVAKPFWRPLDLSADLQWIEDIPIEAKWERLMKVLAELSVVNSLLEEWGLPGTVLYAYRVVITV